MTTPTLLQQLRQTNALRAVDDALARTLQRLDPSAPDLVLAAAALASRAVADGHAGFDIAQPRALIDAADIAWPTPAEWQRALEASPWVAMPESAHAESRTDAPLVLEPIDGRAHLLYLRRYREYERRLATNLRRIANGIAPAEAASAARLLRQSEVPPVGAAAAATLLREIEPAPVGAASAASSSHEIDTNAAGTASAASLSREINTSRLKPLLQETAHAADTAALFATLFPNATAHDDQANAALSALDNTLILITGGPGTGKTTTITRLLVLLIAQALHAGAPAPRIALAAPTGRAAERMAESVRNATQALTAAGVDAALLAHLPTTGTTLHRLLGPIPDIPRFRHHADNPLPLDIVVVDEASMIDLPLMAKLTEAVPDGARLVLLGDPDQLPSVEAGDVLAGILRGVERNGATSDGRHDAPARAPSPRSALDRHPRESGTSAQRAGRPQAGPEGTSEASNPVTLPLESSTPLDPRFRGDDEQEQAPTSYRSPFPARHIHLHRTYRQHDSLDLAPLATAIRNGDTSTALSLLRGGTLNGVHFREALTDPLQSHRDHLLAHWSALADATDPAQALALASRLRLLTAVREGPQGARALNARIETLLSERAAASRRDIATGTDRRYFHGRLLLITENSARHRLFNGDIGICLHSEANPASARDAPDASTRDAPATLMAWFPGDDPQHPRPFHPAALPAHDSAFAMTVHKAQGSEFDAVWLLLPARYNRVLSRELVYTAITRARRELHVAGSGEVIADALARHAGRWSGLGWRLSR